jgi:glycosyltransferase involved in cell wall biosynthesis
MIKVLHVIPFMSPLRGGPTFAATDMTRALVQAGLEVHIATTDDHGPQDRLDVPLGCPVRDNNVTRWYFRRQTDFYTVSWPLTAWLIRHVRDYDLLHIHSLFSYPALIAARCAGIRKIPYVIRPFGTLNRWGMQQRRPLLKKISFALIERHILAHAAKVHFTSEQERQEAEETGARMNAVVLPLGIDLALFQHLPEAGRFRRQHPNLADKTLILFLSRLHPIKGLDLLLPAFARLRQERCDVALVLAGSGDPAYEAELRTQIEALGIEQDVIFTGFVEGEAKTALLADSDLFVLPSYSENFGVVVVEAMAGGLPVIISDQIGLADDIARAEAGLVVPCRIEPLVEAMRSLVSEPNRRRLLAVQARELAWQRYSLEGATQSLIELYENLITGVSHTQRE